MKKIITKSAEETQNLGKRLGKFLFPGAIVSLIGELGSGKTCFVKGMARGLKVKRAGYVNSPSFVLVKEYSGHISLYHLDFYRLTMEEICDLALEEYFYKDGVTAIEWGDKVNKLLPKASLKINFKIPAGADINSREIRFIPQGKIYHQAVKKVFKEIPFAK